MKQTNSKIRLTVVRAVVALVMCSALFTRCANTSTPLGGPKDSLPPVVTSMLPLQGHTNFKVLGLLFVELCTNDCQIRIFALEQSSDTI